MSAIRYTFKAYERLKRQKDIETLFRKGKAFSVFPLKVIFTKLIKAPGERSPVRICFSAPKKKFRTAAKRNRLKRLMKEAWRLQKASLYERINPEEQFHVFMIYTGLEIPDFRSIQDAIEKAIKILQKEARKNVQLLS